MQDYEPKQKPSEPDLYLEYTEARNAYPTEEQAILRLAADRALNEKQKKIWEYWNYDRLTQREIGIKMKLSRESVMQYIHTIEKKLAKWCKEHMEVYNLLKEIE